jgi:hypothetical protein
MADTIDMLTRYEQSQKPRPAEAKLIPGEATDFFDLNDQFQAGGFKIGEKPNDPTQFTDNALNYYTYEVNNIVLPDRFSPTEQGINLNRWTINKPYNVPGAIGLAGNSSK